MIEKDIDLSKLVGFEQVETTDGASVDFQDDAFGARLGAKRGGGEAAGIANVPSLDRD